MAETDAIFGGEHSGHFYFRDFWRADSGMLAALHTLAALAETDRPLSELLDGLPALRPQRGDQLRGRRPAGRARGRRGGVRRDATAPRSTTSTVSPSRTADWWFNVRPSNTEPLLRLNVEGADDAPPWLASATTSSP